MVEYRLPLNHVLFRHPKQLPAKWEVADDWKKNPSTKWTMVINLVKHILKAADDDEMPRQKPGTAAADGEIEFPDIKGEEEGKAKIVVYVEFVKHMPWFSHVRGCCHCLWVHES